MTDLMDSAPPRVLIVDDDAAILSFLTEILQDEGCDVRTAASGAEAQRALDEMRGDVDLLVLDIGLPDADGNEIALRAANRFGARPTVFVTGWVDEFVHLADVPGRWAILRKPIAIPRLLEAIRSLGIPLVSRQKQA